MGIPGAGPAVISVSGVTPPTSPLNRFVPDEFNVSDCAPSTMSVKVTSVAESTVALPNVTAPYLIMLTAFIGQAILLEASLSFLGLGVVEPTPSWGLMVSEGVSQIYAAPWLILLPAFFISTLVVGLNFASDGLANALGLDAARGMHRG